MANVREVIPQKEESFFPFSPYWVVCAVIFTLVAIEIPYRAIHIPPEILIPLGIFVLFAIVFLAFEDHHLILLILVSYLPFSKILPGDFGGFMTAFNLTNILSIVVIVGWIAKRSIRDEPFYSFSSADIPLLLYCFLVTISIARSGIANVSVLAVVFEAKRYLTPFIFYYVFSSNINEEKHIHQILVTMCIAVSMAALMGLKEFYMDIGASGSWERMRVGGITEQPNNLGAFFTYYTYILVAFFLFHIRNLRYWSLVVPILMCMRVTILTISRGATISFALAGLFILWMKNRKLWIATICLIILMICLPQFVPESVIGRFGGASLGVGSPNSMEQSARSRIIIWKRAIKKMRNYFWLGLGYGLFKAAHDNIDAHNGYILIAAEMGVPALALWFIVIGILFWQALWLYKNAASKTFQILSLCFLTSVIGVLISNVFGSRLHSQELSSYYWIMAGITMAAVRMEKTAQGKTEEPSKLPKPSAPLIPVKKKEPFLEVPEKVERKDDRPDGTSIPHLSKW